LPAQNIYSFVSVSTPFSTPLFTNMRCLLLAVLASLAIAGPLHSKLEKRQGCALFTQMCENDSDCCIGKCLGSEGVLKLVSQDNLDPILTISYHVYYDTKAKIIILAYDSVYRNPAPDQPNAGHGFANRLKNAARAGGVQQTCPQLEA
jgi:hypothetical protein